ncbi:MFS transporter [Streptacidiphilus sp. EB129]|uniref:MFS transporter n=1 Tax=Streptacidiphilus sp. EB129 TaxID=3156262 RepID=UPI0035171028
MQPETTAGPAAAAAPATSTAAASPGDRSARRTLAFTLLASVQFTVILAMSVLNVVLPEIQHELGLDRAQLALVNAAYGVSFSGLLLLGGRLADLYGARRAFVAGTGLFGVASVLAGLAPDAWTLLAARFGQGAGAALAVPAAVALVGVLYPEPARQTRVMALWGGLAAFGGTAGMLLSGAVADTDSWRWAFAVPVLVAALAAGSARRLLPAGGGGGRTRGQLDVPGALLVTAGISLLGYGLLQVPDRGWTAGVSLGPLCAGVVLLALFVAVERRAALPILPLSFLATPRRAVALLAVFLGSAGITSVFFMLALYFQQARGYSAPATSAAFLPFGLALVTAGLLVGRLVQRFGPRPVTVGGLALSGLGLALLSGIGQGTPYLGPVLAGLLLFAVGVVPVFAGATVSTMADVPAGQTGTAGAVANTALEMGPALGLTVLVTLAAAHTDALTRSGAATAAAATSGYGFAFGCAAAAFGAAALGAALLLRPRGR